MRDLRVVLISASSYIVPQMGCERLDDSGMMDLAQVLLFTSSPRPGIDDDACGAGVKSILRLRGA